jgi:hypothetical protein
LKRLPETSAKAMHNAAIFAIMWSHFTLVAMIYCGIFAQFGTTLIAQNNAGICADGEQLLGNICFEPVPGGRYLILKGLESRHWVLSGTTPPNGAFTVQQVSSVYAPRGRSAQRDRLVTLLIRNKHLLLVVPVAGGDQC